MRDASTEFDFLVLPGLSNSGVDHWQSYWCLAFRNASRVLQDDWDAPVVDDWLKRLNAAVAAGTRPAVLICHSLSCSLAAHWAAQNPPGRVVAALLVAPSDVEDPAHTPDSVRNFAPIPLVKFAIPTMVAASVDDPYVTLERARAFATAWGSDFCNVGELGHINSASRLEFWPQGLVLLGQLLALVAPCSTAEQ
ncbi:MAG: alpha/beta fold hydrolase [Rhodopseudomonas sp.]|nr:alpha/beta fold hydrolase [Rhodopseudomonas sp.]